MAITGTNPATLDAARRELGNAALVVSSEAGDVRAQKELAKTVAGAFGALDILFLNAGIVEMRPLEKWDEAAFDRSLGVNFKGPYFLIQALLPVFANPASVVLMTSINSHIGMPDSSVYGAGKAALLSLARTLSGELIERGIRLNALTGGPIATPLYGKLGMADTSGLAAQIPVKRLGTPREVAEAALFFASSEATFIVGSELVIDGGMSNL